MCSDDVDSFDERSKQLQDDLDCGRIDIEDFDLVKDLYAKMEVLRKKIEVLARRGLN